ncbi:MAG: NADH-quinone oxidoreductase subunit NuoG [Candidatus Tisiphia sp.]|uniref:NADH-quinone oxidoreductase subunit NuoG n=1 Tax=Candidatus Tisiphia endosymbiont of Psammoecus bipunctatus TaxID=3139333 RepID=UPI001E6ACB02|nr:MAG: NADH-quinone oxidoreductase subunit NuoG [Rickettsia endosymbiont of Cimex lectularius]
MIKLTIDGTEVEVEEGTTVFRACSKLGIEIPHFCFHERLKIAGNCRMCLVEMEKSPKPIASCAMPASSGMVIHTNTIGVKKAREGVMEFLLINHPLDCPICDQGGECDLQDQAFKYGKASSRFSENKRTVKDKYMGPLIKTHMTRCIQCTRCIRFATDIAGVEEIGTLYRGEHMEVTSYLERSLESELSGNIIDICPVGALNSKPYSFKARSWELTKTESIDVLDAQGCNIRVDSRGSEVMRILPRVNDDINEEWISDKARFAYDGLKYQRLDSPYIRKNGKLVEASWNDAIALVAQKLESLAADQVGDQIAAIAGTLACTESMFLLKTLLQKLGCNNFDSNQFNYKIDQSSRGNYLFNTTISRLKEADLALLIGANIRQVAPVLNARIGILQREGKLKVARIGNITNQTYYINELGASPDIIKAIISEEHQFAKELEHAKNPIIIIGDGVYSRDDGYAILALIHQMVDKYKIVRDDWNGFNILHNHASMVGSLDIGFSPKNGGNGVFEILQKAERGEIKFVYLLGSDEIDMNKIKSSFVVYQGHHGDNGANVADVIFPASSYTEKDATYVNFEGRPQYGKAATHPVGQAKEDWVIINNLANSLGLNLGMNNLDEIRTRLAAEFPVFANISEITSCDFIKFTSLDNLLKSDIVTKPINYYMTDSISRASVTMAKCVESKQERDKVA